MFRNRKLTLSALVLILVAFPSLATADRDHSVTIDLGDSKDGGISISLSGEWLDEALVEAVTESIDCDDDADKDVRRMLLHLRKHGEGSRYTLREDDEVTKAWRRNGKLELRKYEPGEEPTHVVMPWAMGECMLGNAKPLRKLGGDFEMKIEKDGEVKLRIE